MKELRKCQAYFANEALALRPACLDHDVARLEVRVQNTRRVHVHHGLGDVKGGLDNGRHAKTAR